ncbi:MAG: DNA gyrase C-terminal beta-propeller domain-containing protein, partial [Oscillospiraceae bacterium]
DVIIISSDGIIIRIPVAEISVYARPAKGVRIMRIAEDEKILSIARAVHDDEEANAHPEAAEADAADIGNIAELEKEEIEEVIEEEKTETEETEEVSAEEKTET